MYPGFPGRGPGLDPLMGGMGTGMIGTGGLTGGGMVLLMKTVPFWAAVRVMAPRARKALSNCMVIFFDKFELSTEDENASIARAGVKRFKERDEVIAKK